MEKIKIETGKPFPFRVARRDNEFSSQDVLTTIAMDFYGQLHVVIRDELSEDQSDEFYHGGIDISLYEANYEFYPLVFLRVAKQKTYTLPFDSIKYGSLISGESHISSKMVIYLIDENNDVISILEVEIPYEFIEMWCDRIDATKVNYESMEGEISYNDFIQSVTKHHGFFEIYTKSHHFGNLAPSVHVDYKYVEGLEFEDILREQRMGSTLREYSVE